MKLVLTIAGSDASGGAGVQADLKTFQRRGVYGVCAITAITAQNPMELKRVFSLPPGMVTAQIDAVIRWMRVSAVKTGMLGSAGIVEAVAGIVSKRGLRPLVVDPVIAAQSGGRLLSREAESALVRLLFPLANLVTPNVHEAERLTGMKIKGTEDVREAARRLFSLGPAGVLITGGHASGREVTDWFYDGSSMTPFKSTREGKGSMHGSGCILSAAIAAGLAQGLSLRRAIQAGRAYVRREIRRSWKVGDHTSVARHA